ncbi:hypothetical protein KCU85_g144, partial [Aureobasidium melanogenum]
MHQALPMQPSTRNALFLAKLRKTPCWWCQHIRTRANTVNRNFPLPEHTDIRQNWRDPRRFCISPTTPIFSRAIRELNAQKRILLYQVASGRIASKDDLRRFLLRFSDWEKERV